MPEINFKLKGQKQAIKYFNEIVFSHLVDINCWIAGGAVRDYFLYGYVKPNTDIDLYFSSVEEFSKARILLSNNNILYENNNSLKILINGFQFDLIKIYFESPDACISKFDFTVCTGAITKEKCYFQNRFFDDLSYRKINFQFISDPYKTLYRLQKYIKYGFYIENESLRKLMLMGSKVKDPPKSAPIDINMYSE